MQKELDLKKLSEYCFINLFLKLFYINYKINDI